ncbi:MAG: hypothetical protein IKJ84_04420 [Oscillospiraceae bacterium]|nr:hypothetical protein [Oscillospiraceae bacterium]
MKRLLPLLLCLLLLGCAPSTPETLPTEPAPVPETAPTPISMYDGDHPLEMAYYGALKVYPLTTRKTQGFRTLGEDILTFSGYGSTTLTLLTGRELTLTASRTLDFELSPTDPSLQIWEDGLCFYDPNQQLLRFLDDSLTETHTIPLPQTAVGSPILSQDRQQVYYCTSSALFCWDRTSGLHRRIKEMSYEAQTLTGLHLEETVLQCRICDNGSVYTLFLDTQTGQLLHRLEGEVSLSTLDSRFYAAIPLGSMEQLLYGEAGRPPQILYPEDLAAWNRYLPREQLLVTVSSLDDQRTQLTGYDLTTGTQQVQLTLDAFQSIRDMASTGDGTVLFLVYDPASDGDILYRWETASTVFSPEDPDSRYSLPYDSAAEDPAALERCREEAARLSEKYGFRILVAEDALAVQPWDYEFTAETQSQVLSRELELLDLRLSQYPQAVLEKTASHFSSLTLCLVRSIHATPASGSLEAATGIQFLDGSDAYVAITLGKYSQQALYHELYHVMETHILNESTALDQWNDLNPEGFSYSLGYDLPEGADSWLTGADPAFADSYSMTWPKEDRARIFEKAMLPGNRELFSGHTLQAKLAALCQGIRSAYGLRKSPETFPWEQYLLDPLAYCE